MLRDVYRYTFSEGTSSDEVEVVLLLALFSVESLYGEVQTRLDAGYECDANRRTYVLDAGTPVGRDLNRLFVGFLRKDLGENGFKVERLEGPAAAELGRLQESALST